MCHKNRGNRKRKKKREKRERSEKQQHLNRRASFMDEAREREKINPKAEQSSSCCSFVQGSLWEGERRGRQRKLLARHRLMLTHLVPTQFLSLGAGNALCSPMFLHQAQPAASPQQALLATSVGKSPSACGTAQACWVGNSSPLPLVTEQRLHFAGIWQNGRDQSPAMIIDKINSH